METCQTQDKKRQAENVDSPDNDAPVTKRSKTSVPEEESAMATIPPATTIVDLCKKTVELCHNFYQQEAHLEKDYEEKIAATIQELVTFISECRTTLDEKKDALIRSIWDMIAEITLYRKLIEVLTICCTILTLF